MVDGLGGFGRPGGGLVEPVAEDRFDAAVAAAVDSESPRGGRFQAGGAVALGQALEPEAGAVGLLGMTPGEDGGDQGGGVRSDLPGPVDEAVGRPVAHAAVLLGPVLRRGGVAPLVRRADVAGDALPAVEALDGAGRQPDVELAADERVRDRVVVPVDHDVVVGGHPDGLPLGEDVGAVGQRAQRRPVELLELRAPRPRELAERPGVEPFEQPGDRRVELGQREERAVAEGGEDPPLDHLNGHLRLRLVPGPPHPRGQHRHAVVAGEVVIGRVQVRLVAVGVADPRAKVVGDHQLGAPAVELEGAHVRRRPVRQGLRPRRLGEGVARRPEDRHEDLRPPLLAGLAVDHRHRLPGVVDEQLLAGAVVLAHHQVELPGPGPVLLAEPAVLQALGVALLVLLPEQRQRHALAPQLPVDLAPVRQRPLRAARRRRRKQPTLQSGVLDRLGYGPTQPRHLGAAQVLAHRRRRRPQAAGDGSDAQRGGEVQPQHISNLAHGQPPVRQRSSLLKSRKGLTAGGSSRAAQLRRGVIGLDRNR